MVEAQEPQPREHAGLAWNGRAADNCRQNYNAACHMLRQRWASSGTEEPNWEGGENFPQVWTLDLSSKAEKSKSSWENSLKVTIRQNEEQVQNDGSTDVPLHTLGWPGTPWDANGRGEQWGWETHKPDQERPSNGGWI